MAQVVVLVAVVVVGTGAGTGTGGFGGRDGSIVIIMVVVVVVVVAVVVVVVARGGGAAVTVQWHRTEKSFADSFVRIAPFNCSSFLFEWSQNLCTSHVISTDHAR